MLDGWFCWRLYAKGKASLEALNNTLSIDEVYEANLVEDLIDEREKREAERQKSAARSRR